MRNTAKSNHSIGLLAAAVALAALSVLAGCSSEPPAPKTVAIVYTNNMDGEIRSCGCVSNDLGGLGRRATFVEMHRAGGQDLFVLEGGDMFGVDVNYGKEKAELTLRSYALMDYTGIVPGEADLIFGVDFLKGRVEALDLPIVAANLIDAATDKLVFPAFHTAVMPSGLKVGVIGVIEGVELPEAAAGLKMSSARAAIDRLAPVLRDEHGCDLVVVLAHVPLPALRKMASRLQGVDFIVMGHDAMPMRKIQKLGSAHVLTTSDRGRFVGLVYATLDKDGTVASVDGGLRGLGVDLDDNQAVAKLFESYDMDVRRMEITRRTTIPAGHLERRYVGAEKCQSCHADIYTQWKGTKHSHAFDILTNLDRQYDRDCTPCHTAGFYEAGGFLSIDQTPDLVHVQCESCHGNGGSHALNPTIKTSSNARTVCVNCHTEQQTPDFDFEEWWGRIQH